TMRPNQPHTVSKSVTPPTIDYHAMWTEANLNDPTYFTSETAAVTYMISKRVTEVVGGRTLQTVKIGTAANPEFLYIVGSLSLDVWPTNSDSPGSGKIQA